MESAAIALILLDMKSKGLCIGKLPTQVWEGKISEDSVKSDWTWLLAYEAYRHGWMVDHNKLLNKSLFKAMASRKVVFMIASGTLARLPAKLATEAPNVKTA